jgi:Ca-activated chloride channel family protein
MTFGSPGWLFCLLLLPAVVAAYLWSRRRRRSRTAALAAQGLVTTEATKSPGWPRHVPFALFMAALALLVVACARPMASIKAPRRQATVVLALDVSNSMGATDVRPSRIGAAQIAARSFVHQQPAAVRIGVVAFGAGAVIVQPPTLDRTDVLSAINHLSLGGGTSLGAGILTSLDAIAGKTIKVNQAELAQDASGEVNVGFYGGSTIVLISDGENTSQANPLTWARLASIAGVRVQTIGVGTPAGTTVRIGGFTVATALNSQALKGVAAVTNGSYHQIDDQSGLKAISKTINLHFRIVTQYTEITAIFAAVAAMLLVAGALVSLLWFGRVV